MNIKQTQVNCDLTLASFEMAVGMLGVMPNIVTLYCPATHATLAYKIKAEYDCAVVLVPSELMATKYCWAAAFGSDVVWSPGA